MQLNRIYLRYAWSFISTSVWRCRTCFTDVRDGRGMNEWHAWKGWWALYRATRTHVHIYIHIYTWADVRSREREGPTADTAPKWIIHEERASERGHAGAPPYHVRGTPLPREWDVGPRNLYMAITRHAVIIPLLMPNILARTDVESAQGWEGDSPRRISRNPIAITVPGEMVRD